ncbi:MAG: quinol dehydrogenase ferredoxin subunit NapH [Rhodospirillales bacterium]|jgi:ferredoxin-type protein NapH|nr:quinol dehydrogenase ferredoxin subunit NapH [Rhodospirillales bacterium]MBT3904276.1 quinol dehydrogenase ferredoxin subunit NapH [Rhodospirillaceae bacterium]MBT5033149.1 quinol dehydrogenase ferredoxin subunit NapH [Rhodospirillaceae bacterium]MBT6363955.1 quinol dehydrogenase ferredoxin subunit NapH [Rhodospirillaceae bacterium]MBT8004981.1 quinol dehydrogenase ferredoxin subunit NapH [Rhodospirillales bacterium]
MSEHHVPGLNAVITKGYAAYKWLLIRRTVQLLFLGLFLIGPLTGFWIVKGTATSSITLGFLELTDPYVALQSLVAGHITGTAAIIGAAILFTVYALIGGRTYCSFFCPVNIVTDAAHWLAQLFGVDRGIRLNRHTRLWVLGMTLVVSAVTGTIAWEFVNPVTLTHRGLVFGIGFAWSAAAMVFLFDLFVSRRGWCSHLCPVGAFYSLVGSFSLIRISAQDRAKCNNCMDCFAVCPEPHTITPALKGDGGPLVLSGDCTNCGRCIDVCAENVFKFGLRTNNHRPELTPVAEFPSRKAA